LGNSGSEQVRKVQRKSDNIIRKKTFRKQKPFWGGLAEQWKAHYHRGKDRPKIVEGMEEKFRKPNSKRRGNNEEKGENSRRGKRFQTQQT